MPQHHVKRRSPFEDRFIPEPNSGCWLWLGGVQSKGYGMFDWGGRKGLATHYAYEKYVGPIADGMQVLHKYDTPLCVNPDHLFLGTRRDNMRDASRKGRLHFGEANGMFKLTTKQVLEIRHLCASNVPETEVASRFSVDRSTVNRIVTGRRRARS